jgi:hypothetical protein
MSPNVIGIDERHERDVQGIEDPSLITDIHHPRVRARQTTSMSCALTDAAALSSGDVMLTTHEAGRLVGRSEGAVRKALGRGTLRGQRDREIWHVRAADVVAWAACSRSGPGNPLPAPRTEDTVHILREYESASAEEVATLLGVHPGNARKYLAMLALQGRARRRADGQWVLTDNGLDQEAPTAS